jgi:hypothetical protein
MSVQGKHGRGEILKLYGGQGVTMTTTGPKRQERPLNLLGLFLCCGIMVDETLFAHWQQALESQG